MSIILYAGLVATDMLGSVTATGIWLLDYYFWNPALFKVYPWLVGDIKKTVE